MSDLDDDLLALAGGEEDEEVFSDNAQDAKKPKNTRAPTDEDEDDAIGNRKRRTSIPKDDDDDDDLEALALGGKDDDGDDAMEDATDFRNNHSRNDAELDELQEFRNPYPLEGKYKNDADRQELLAMTEIKRETILFERMQEIEAYNQKVFLVQRAQERRARQEQDQAAAAIAAEKAATRSKRDKSASSSTKQSQLSELKKKREERQSREKTGKPNVPYRERRHDGDYSDGAEDDDDEEDDGDDYDEEESDPRLARGRGASSSATKRRRGRYDDDEAYDEGGFIENDEEPVEWAESKKTKELTLNDINKIRFGRTLFSKYCHNPGFEKVVSGTYVRVNIGYDHKKQQPVYRICEVKKLVSAPKPYTFQNRTVDEAILVASAKNEKTFEMGICSDSPFSEDEFRWWKQHMLKDDLSLPTVKRVERKLAELMEFKNHKLTDAEVRDMVERRQKLSANVGVGVSRVLQKSQLQEKRAIAVSNGDRVAIEEIDRQLAAIETSSNKAAQQESTSSSLSKLAAVNARNRRANVSGIRQAELKNVGERRKMSGKTGGVFDPFSRVRTAARIFHQSDEGSSESTPAPASQDDEMELKRKREEAEAQAKKRKASARMAFNIVDNKIAQIDFHLDIVI